MGLGLRDSRGGLSFLCGNCSFLWDWLIHLKGKRLRLWTCLYLWLPVFTPIKWVILASYQKGNSAPSTGAAGKAAHENAVSADYDAGTDPGNNYDDGGDAVGSTAHRDA